MTTFVGIVNITPDSFSDGGLFLEAKNALAQARKLHKDGASIIDIGAQSTRPSAKLLSIDEEWRRLEPVLTLLSRESFEVSIDTFYPEIVARARTYRSDLIINDVTTAHTPYMRQLVVDSGLRIFLSHLPFSAHGDIQTAHALMQPLDNIETVKNELLIRRDELLKLGAEPEQIILDPGIGFGKTMRLNAELVEFAREVPGIPVLVGFSRKRFIEQYLHKDRLSAAINSDLAKKAINTGATYLRVHEIPTTE